MRSVYGKAINEETAGRVCLPYELHNEISLWQVNKNLSVMRIAQCKCFTIEKEIAVDVMLCLCLIVKQLRTRRIQIFVYEIS